LSSKSNFIIDIGNSRIKSSEVQDNKILESKTWEQLESLVEALPKNKKTIVCSVKHNSEQIKNIFGDEVFIFNNYSKLPIEINYYSPQTLGCDRIASAVGAQYLFPSEDLLIIDAGSCITYDLLIKNSFEGGLISPGFKMRLRAMHEMTGQLPDLTEQSDQYTWELIGKSTASCMISGARNGLKNEMNGIISQLKEKYAALRILMTGGDAVLFENNLKDSIFVRSNLIPLGLNQILINNEDI
tara:strand:+ start:4843 stop:5568 length:726 start_codon:yes stop_codon:yes gene_type:complete